MKTPERSNSTAGYRLKPVIAGVASWVVVEGCAGISPRHEVIPDSHNNISTVSPPAPLSPADIEKLLTDLYHNIGDINRHCLQIIDAAKGRPDPAMSSPNHTTFSIPASPLLGRTICSIGNLDPKTGAGDVHLTFADLSQFVPTTDLSLKPSDNESDTLCITKGTGNTHPGVCVKTSSTQGAWRPPCFFEAYPPPKGKSSRAPTPSGFDGGECQPVIERAKRVIRELSETADSHSPSE